MMNRIQNLLSSSTCATTSGGGGGGLGQGRADVRLNSVRQNVEHMRTVVHDLGSPGSPGRSVQVDPVKPMLNAPKTKRLKK